MILDLFSNHKREIWWSCIINIEKAFVLINCEPGQEPCILEQLRSMNNVIDAQGTYGVYDIIARIESDNQSQLKHIVSDKIRKLDNVNSTLTLIPTEEQNILPDMIPDMIPDVIPEQKKPIDESSSSENEEEDLDDYDEAKSH